MNNIPLSCSCNGCLLRTLFFENVTQEELGIICSAKFELSYKKGDTIVREGDTIANFMYLKEGLIKIFKTDNDNSSQIISIAKPMDFVSTLTVFSDSHYHYSVTAIEDSTVCCISLDVIKGLVTNNGKFALNILSKISIASDNIIKLRLDLGKKQLRGRIAYILLYFSQYIYNKMEFELPVSRKEFAELIGMTTENVIRAFSELRKDKIIKINGKTIEIINFEMLKKISDLG